MEFIFKGEEAVTYIYGLTFPNGVAVNVTEEHAIKKLLNHPQFDQVGGDDGLDDVPAPPAREEQGYFKRKVGRPKGR